MIYNDQDLCDSTTLSGGESRKWSEGQWSVGWETIIRRHWSFGFGIIHKIIWQKLLNWTEIAQLNNARLDPCVTMDVYQSLSNWHNFRMMIMLIMMMMMTMTTVMTTMTTTTTTTMMMMMMIMVMEVVATMTMMMTMMTMMKIMMTMAMMIMMKMMVKVDH